MKFYEILQSSTGVAPDHDALVYGYNKMTMFDWSFFISFALFRLQIISRLDCKSLTLCTLRF